MRRTFHWWVMNSYESYVIFQGSDKAINLEREHGNNNHRYDVHMLYMFPNLSISVCPLSAVCVSHSSQPDPIISPEEEVWPWLCVRGRGPRETEGEKKERERERERERCNGASHPVSQPAHPSNQPFTSRPSSQHPSDIYSTPTL